jgi:hypothetical protein
VSGKPFRGFESHPLRQFEVKRENHLHGRVISGVTARLKLLVTSDGFIETTMKRSRQRFIGMALGISIGLLAITGSVEPTAGQSHTVRQPARRGSICGNPTAACKTSATFQAHDLPFRVPANSVIFDTEWFYAIILKSVPGAEDGCNTFVPETERLNAQTLFPDRKVFASRCVEPGELFYTNVDSKHRIMAVYAGTTLAESKRTLAAVNATGKFSGAYMRRMRTGFNGT